MRVALFFSSNPKEYGGVQEHVFQLGRYLEKLGVEVFYLGAAGGKHKFPHYIEIGSAHPLVLPYNRISYLVLNQSVKTISSRLIDLKIDLLHIHEPYLPFGAWELMKESRIPIVGTFHCAWDYNLSENILNLPLTALSSWFGTHSSGAIFVSQASLNLWRPLTNKITHQAVIPNGISEEYFQPPQKKSFRSTKHILFMGRIVPRKGLTDLIQAIRILKDNYSINVFLDVVGSGVDMTNAKRMARNLNLLHSIKFHGSIDDTTKRRLIIHSYCMCAPYRNESFGITLLESMAAGCPIVGYWNHAYADYLSDYPEQKMFVEQGDISSLSGSLAMLIQNSDLRDELSAWGISKSKEYSWHKISRQILNLYNSVISKSSVTHKKPGKQNEIPERAFHAAR